MRKNKHKKIFTRADNADVTRDLIGQSAMFGSIYDATRAFIGKKPRFPTRCQEIFDGPFYDNGVDKSRVLINQKMSAKLKVI